jgi:hypothetical protein
MRRSRKLILIALLSIVVLAGSIGGVVLADTEEEEDVSQPQLRYGGMLEKVCEIYEQNTGDAVDPQELQNAFAQAGKEIAAEARENFRQRLIEEGKATQEQLDDFDAWMAEKPEGPLPFGPRNHGGIRPFGGFGKFGGGFPRWGGQCAPQTTE